MYKSINFVKIFLLLCLLVDFSAGQDSESEKGGVDKLYFKSSALFQCLIQLPEDFENNKNYKLVIGMHGGGSTPENLINLWRDSETTNFIYAVPQAPYSWLIGESMGYDWSFWPSGDAGLMKRASNITTEYIADLTNFLNQQYKIKETYLLGFSQGAIFSYIGGIKNFQLIDGLIIFSGPGLLKPLISPFAEEPITNWLSEESIEAANSLRVILVHGKDDQRVKYELGIQSKDVLKSYDYDVTFYDFTGGHVVPPANILEQVNQWISK
jgi:phospholipase/carboxylesterase